MPPKSLPKKNKWSWRSQAFRGWVYQIIATGLIGLAVWFLLSNTLHNMRVRGIQSGFEFLNQAAGFSISESFFSFDSSENYWRAFLVGISNTLRVAVAGIIASTILGTLLGIGRFSRSPLVRGLCSAYVECVRNIPVLLQLLMWYLILTEMFPPLQDAWKVGPFFLSKGGVNFPIPVWETGQAWAAAGLGVGIALAWIYRRWAKKKI